MEQLNRIELQGTVGSVVVHVIGNSRVARFSLATNYAFKDKQGCPVIETTWHQVTAWEGERVCDLDMISRGSALRVEGRLRIQRYTASDGSERTAFDVVASSVTPLPDEGRILPQEPRD